MCIPYVYHVYTTYTPVYTKCIPLIPKKLSVDQGTRRKKAKLKALKEFKDPQLH